MDMHGKRLLVVGDRVLISPAEGEDRTRVGLLLPATAVEKARIQGGTIVEVGPGTSIPSLTDHSDEPWKLHGEEPAARYVPMEAKVGDFALFLRNSAIEIEFEGEKYLVVPHAAILLLIRKSHEAARPPDGGDVGFDEKDFQL